MIDANSSDRSVAKEIMLAYVSALGTTAPRLFRKKGHETPNEQDFTETWETILKTVSDHN
jgi:hypothetical protein